VRDPLRRLVDRLARRLAVEVRRELRTHPIPDSRAQYATIATLTARHGYDSLASAELRVFSQNGEDGVIAEIFHRVGTTNRCFVEFGVEDGLECNTRFLSEVLGWSGVYFEPDPEAVHKLRRRLAPRTDVRVFNRAVTAENVNDLFSDAGVPPEPDLVSIDVDGQDYWIWQAMSARPRVLVVEYNSALDPDSRLVEPSGTPWHAEKTEYFGASLGAMESLGKAKGYRLIYADLAGVNLFFVRDDCEAEIDPPLRRGVNYGLHGARHRPGEGAYESV
jgi:hypothetical protein